jgi:hypothetical protein
MQIRGLMSAIGALVASVALLGTAPAPAAPLAPPADLSASARDAAFLLNARSLSLGTRFDDMSDDTLIDLAGTFCSAIDQGIASVDFRTSAELLEIPADKYRSVLSLSEAYYCPEHIGVGF